MKLTTEQKLDFLMTNQIWLSQSITKIAKKLEVEINEIGELDEEEEESEEEVEMKAVMKEYRQLNNKISKSHGGFR